MALVLKHQTVEQFVARCREAYRAARTDRLVAISKFLIAQVQAGNLTETQIRNAFGMNVTQWNNLKAQMQALIAASNTVESAVGV